ncbi:TAXI family TRAP transporter solute-binding subunit [Xanthobacteraceae bacterium Astr-EGSB]|uniref:TAXI family TRAP transporter solute-binding subunit n=1 Tax=Astrobacterium formosum TaxID=3069710 RepID=UPI0027AEED57|nr:TAXI family TRAP transporter solute-binding subunit [Xanthobacteraceae bacterium Astr-EGSB]
MQRIREPHVGLGRPFFPSLHFVAIAALAAIAILASGSLATAQTQLVPGVQRDAPESSLKVNRNMWTVGVAAGLLEGTNMRLADEMAKVLDDGDNLRVLPIVSHGAASNLDDLLYLRGIDVAITQSDVFEYFRTERKTTNLAERVHYILRLPVSELHILARTDVKKLEDLRGKRVNFGPPGSGSALTASILFQRLGIDVQQAMVNNQTALQQLRNGEIDALIRSIGKPVDFFTKIPSGSGLHFVPIPYSQAVSDFYALAEFNSKDYPNLVPSGGSVETIATPAVLAVFNWAPGSDRHRRVKRFVENLFANWERLQNPPFHPKWRDINLAATVPGWKRFAVAEQQLQFKSGAAGDTTEQDFRLFLRQIGTLPKSEAEREALFQNFLTWRERQSRRQR